MFPDKGHLTKTVMKCYSPFGLLQQNTRDQMSYEQLKFISHNSEG